MNESVAVGVSVDRLSSAIDRPAGRAAIVASAVNGKPLRYFIPDPLPELIGRCGDAHQSRPKLLSDSAIALSLSRIAARRGLSKEVDTVQAARFCKLIVDRVPYKSRDQLMGLGRGLSTRNQGFRQEIIFAGAPVASEATTVFAPDAMIPALMDALVDALNQDWTNTDPTILTALAGFYGVSVHPFVDGNGRWSRLIAASLGMSAGLTLPAMANVVFQNVCKSQLADEVWLKARNGGLREYLALSWRFENALLAQLRNAGLFDITTHINDELQRSSRNARVHKEALIAIYSRQEISLAWMRSLYGMSARAFEGMLERVVSASGSLIEVQRESLRIESLQMHVDRAVEFAKETTFSRN